MKTKVLLTGISGFAGSHVLEHLLENTDWDIVGIASWEHKGTPERIEEAVSGKPSWRNRVEIITHDLSVPFTETTKKRIGYCDYILNLASDSHVDRSIEDPMPFVKNNVGIALTMLEWAREMQPKIFLQFSTDEVYGMAPEDVHHKEWSSIVPSNPYSASKACQEAIAISYWRTYNVPLIITNTMNLFGEMQDTEKYMAKCIKLILEDGIVPVHGNEKFIGSRYYLHARNMADAVLFILRHIQPVSYEEGKTLLPERFNIVGDVELSNLQVAQEISEVLGKPLRYELTDFHATRPGHDRRYALDGFKLKKEGWRAPLTFKASLKKYIEWTLGHNLWK